MHLTPQTQAIILLTISLGKPGPQRAKPLSNREWARFAVWLKDHDLDPASLLKGDLQSHLAGWMDRSISIVRIQELLERGAVLGLSLDKWERAGLWVLTRSDPDYPDRLKQRLRSEAPAVLFGCGNKKVLKQGGIAVVGSRDASDADLAFTEKLAKGAATQGLSIVSGGARGVDQSAIIGTLDNEGTAVGVLADSLLRSAISAKYRKYIMSGDLALVTPFNPEAGFNVGNAMSRNRYIYCTADAAVVINSTSNRGGTWNGACEDLKESWVPLWIKRNTSSESGNSALVQKGAHWLPEDLTSLASLMGNEESLATEETQSDPPPETPHSENGRFGSRSQMARTAGTTTAANLHQHKFSFNGDG